MERISEKGGRKNEKVTLRTDLNCRDDRDDDEEDGDDDAARDEADLQVGEAGVLRQRVQL